MGDDNAEKGKDDSVDEKDGDPEVHTDDYEFVESPSHYNTGRIEVIDFIEDQRLDFNLGSAIKYICRAGRKPGSSLQQDLAKAIWYLRRKIDHDSD